MTDAGLSARNLAKSFGATAALADVSFDMRGGEVHALVGENGAGKSTLVNILSGVIAPDFGVLVVGGREARFDSPRAAQSAGVATVHQGLSLAEHVSVAEDLFAGRPSAPARRTDRPQARWSAHLPWRRGRVGGRRRSRS